MFADNVLRIGPYFNAEGHSGGGHHSPQSPIESVVIPVGGLGSRMFPLTLATPKNLLPLGSKTLISHAVDEAVMAGAQQIIIVCSPKDKESYQAQFNPSEAQLKAVENKPELRGLVSHYENLGAKIEFVVQEEPKGLGHAILQAQRFIDSPFGVILPDDVILDEKMKPVGLKSMVDSYQGGMSLASVEVPSEDTSRYGIFNLGTDNADPEAKVQQIVGVVEKPESNAPSNLAIMGRYILTPDIFPLLAQEKIGAGGEIQLTDAIELLIEEGHPAYAAQYAGTRYDCGTPEGYAQAQKIVLSRLYPSEPKPASASPKPERVA